MVIVNLILVLSNIMAADQIIITPPDLITPLQDYSVSLFNSSDTHLITSDANWRGLAAPGRRVISHTDTVSVIFTQTTTDPNAFQVFYHAYSTDGGDNWTPVQAGNGNYNQIKSHQAQCFDFYIVEPEISVCPYLFWTENGFPYYTYDELPPFQLFTQVNICSISLSSICGVAWDDNHRFATGINTTTSDIWGFTSTDGGTSWNSAVIVPKGAAIDQIAAICDKGSNGYIFLYYGRQLNANGPILTYYIESTNYGITWTSPKSLMTPTINNGQDTLSLSLSGYSLIVEPLNFTPYIIAKFDTSKSCTESYDFGEIYFTKPSGGNPGNYNFQSDQYTPVIAGSPDSFEHISGFPSIGLHYQRPYYWYDLKAIYCFSLSALDTLGGWNSALTAEYSTDLGNSWDVSIVAPILDSFSYYFPNCSKHNFDNLSHIEVTFIKEFPSFSDLDNLHLYHKRYDFYDLVGFQEQPGPNIPSYYLVEVKTKNNQIQFNLNLPQDGHTTLKIYDITGREIQTVIDRPLPAGNHVFNWIYDNPPGNYIYRLTSGEYKNWGRCMTL